MDIFLWNIVTVFFIFYSNKKDVQYYTILDSLSFMYESQCYKKIHICKNNTASMNDVWYDWGGHLGLCF